MSVNGRDSFSGNHNIPPNGRKRKLSNRNSHSSSDSSRSSSSSPSSSSTKQTRLNFTPNHKRQKLTLNSNSNHSPPSLHHTNCREELENSECSDMAHQPGTNNRMSIGSNNFVAGKAAVAKGTNNHVKKPTQGKKLVIKNRKGKTTCRPRVGESIFLF